MKTYIECIKSMAQDMDIVDRLPSMYIDEYEEAVANLLFKEAKDYEIAGKIVFEPIFCNREGSDEILRLMAKFITEDSPTSKQIIANKICKYLESNAKRFYRETIENDVDTYYRRNFNSNKDKIVNDVDTYYGRSVNSD